MGCCCNSKAIKKEDYFGENSNRKCRDVFWLLLFLIFIAGMFVIAILGFVNGDIKRFYYGTDMYGNICGSNNKNTKYKYPNTSTTNLDMTNKKYVYFPTPLDPSINYCVEECPSYDSLPNYKQQVEDAIISGNFDGMTMSCIYDVNFTLSELNVRCWPMYPSFDVVHRCLPDVTNSTLIDSMFTMLFNVTSVIDTNSTSVSGLAKSLIDILNSRSGITKAISDVATMWWLLLASIGFACIVAYIWLAIVKYLVKPLVYLTLLACQCGSIAFTVYLWKVANEMKSEVTGEVQYSLSDDATQQLIVQVFAYIFLGVSILIFVLLVFLRKRIKLAIAIIKEASSALRNNFCVSFFPLVQYLIYAVILAYWVIVALFLASVYKTSTTDTITVDVNYGSYEPDVPLQYMLIYHIFGGLWLLFFFSGVGKTTISGVIAAWYWISDEKKRSSLSTTASFFRTLRYNAGSIAFGSLLMATIRFIRILFEYFARLKARAVKKNITWLKYALKIVSCCLWCFEKIIKFVTESTYIMIAIAGKSFCKSAAHVLSLQANNFIRVIVLKGIAGFTLMMTRFAISIFTALAAAIICRYKGKVDITTSFYTATSLHYWYIPTILCFIFAWMVSGLFTNVYDVAIDTVMLSFCEDESLPGVAHNDNLAKLMKKKDSGSSNNSSSTPHTAQEVKN